MNATDRPTRATAYPVSDVIIGANSAFARVAPGIIAVLDAYETTNALVSESLAYMRDNNASPERAAAEFLRANVALWRPWVSEDAAARILAALGG
jgi:glycine betaine/proline transport system substrate-binding protein